MIRRNRHIRMISEASCDTEEWSNLKFSNHRNIFISISIYIAQKNFLIAINIPQIFFFFAGFHIISMVHPQLSISRL